MWSFPCVFEQSGKANKAPAVLAARSPSCRRFSSIANAANVQLSTLKGERRRRTGNTSLWSKSEMQSEALSSKSLGTTHCRHYILLHYIHQPLHLWSCRRAQNRRLSLSAAVKNSSSLGRFSVALFPPNPALLHTSVFKTTCVTLNLTKSVWSEAEVFSFCLRGSESEGAEPRFDSLWTSAHPFLVHFSHTFSDYTVPVLMPSIRDGVKRVPYV